jgi:hypothetical protein
MRLGMLAALTTSILAAQPADVQSRVFQLTHAPELHDLAIGFRSLGEVRELSMSPEQRTIRVKGTPAQLALAEWLFREVDRPAPPGQSVASEEHKMPGLNNDIVRVIYLQNAMLPQLQEMAVNVRTIGNITALFTLTPIRAMVLRAPEPNVSFAVWLAKALDAPATRTAQQYRFPGDPGDIGLISYFAENTTIQQLQEMAVNLRVIANIRTMGTASAMKALCMRGTSRQMELAGWLIEKLDPAAPRGTTPEWGVADDLVRVHYLSTAKAQDISKRLRAAGMRQVASHGGAALILRGATAVLAQARNFIEEQDR